MSFALAGVRVLDLTRLLPGAICTMFLADMGADVLKIEDPVAGDYARWTPPLVDGLGAFFRASNRNKRSMILNLKESAGQVVIYDLVRQADVVIEGFRPQVTKRLGIDYDTLKTINPQVVYCSLSGWGQTGGYAEMSGHDLNYVALSGLLGSMATPQPLGGQIADIGGAYAGALAIVAGLFQREKTHMGTNIDIALYEAAMPFAFYQIVESFTGYSRGGHGSLTGGMAFYQVYISADDVPMAFAPIEPKFWENFCRAVNRLEWLPLHTDLAQQEFLKAELSALFKTQTAQAWHALLYHADCCFTLITPPEALLNDPQVIARDMAGINQDGVPYLRNPARIGQSQITPIPAPHYGEHTDAVLKALGYDDQRIADLKTQKITSR